ISAGLSVVLFIISFGLYFVIDPMYSGTFTQHQLHLAKQMFCISCATMMVGFIETALGGLITGYNKFIFGNGNKFIFLLARIALLVIYLQFSNNPVGILVINFILSLVALLVQIIYIRRVLRVKIKFTSWEKVLFFDAGKYTILMFITSVVTQIFSNLDNVVIGSIKGPELVTVYSVGLLIFGTFSQISCSVSGVMLPTVTNALHKQDGRETLLRVITKSGRVQFALLGAALAGFICVGKDFVYLWMGEGYEDVYIITLILIIPAVFELCINTCLSILRAENKLGFRTVIVLISALLNAVITVVLVKEWSYIGAAIGTAFSYFACSLVAMNIYYSKKLHLPMLKIYKGIVGKIWLCLLISAGALFFFSRYVNGSWTAFILCAVFFCVIYAALLLVFGLTKEEKREIPIIGKLFRR
ncbi:MAG: polysaccharide biosynthesis C-terminal domain-containing protein, partial [Ruminococcus sp.]|nr:polysaccharide biosynthesis C-terminal domain-containing protein [Candidatus Copronaster equi]